MSMSELDISFEVLQQRFPMLDLDMEEGYYPLEEGVMVTFSWTASCGRLAYIRLAKPEVYDGWTKMVGDAIERTL